MVTVTANNANDEGVFSHERLPERTGLADRHGRTPGDRSPVVPYSPFDPLKSGHAAQCPPPAEIA